MNKSKKDLYVRFRIDEKTKEKVIKIGNATGRADSDIYREANKLLINMKYTNIF